MRSWSKSPSGGSPPMMSRRLAPVMALALHLSFFATTGHGQRGDGAPNRVQVYATRDARAFAAEKRHYSQGYSRTGPTKPNGERPSQAASAKGVRDYYRDMR